MMRPVLCVLVVAAAVRTSPLELQSQLAGGLNIPEPHEVSPQDQRRYEAYNVFPKSLEQGSEQTASLCNNFYNYTCQHVDVVDYLNAMEKGNTKIVAEGLKRVPTE